MEIRALAKGLSFCPSSIRDPDYTASITKLSRSIRLKSYFEDSEMPTKPPPFRRKSTWAPPAAPRHIEAYLSTLNSKLGSISPQKTTNNMSPGERKALKSLAADNTIVIKKADKGSCLVVENTSDYITDGEAHLADDRIYQEIPGDYTESITNSINALVRSAFAKGAMHADNVNINFRFLMP